MSLRLERVASMFHPKLHYSGKSTASITAPPGIVCARHSIVFCMMKTYNPIHFHDGLMTWSLHPLYDLPTQNGKGDRMRYIAA